MFVVASRTTLLNGFLFRFKFTADRLHFSFTDQALADRVADNVDKFDETESESLVIGRDFGIATDIQTAPNGNVFVVSLSNGAIYEIKSKPSLLGNRKPRSRCLRCWASATCCVWKIT